MRLALGYANWYFTGIQRAPSVRFFPSTGRWPVVSQALPVGTFDLVIFGGTGDLARRKLLPALLQRFADGQIEAQCRIVAIARDALSAEEYRNHIRPELASNLDRSAQADKVLDDFLAHVDYRSIDATRDAG